MISRFNDIGGKEEDVILQNYFHRILKKAFSFLLCVSFTSSDYTKIENES